MATVNQLLRDEVVAQELQLRRVGAGINNKVQARLTQLEKDLKALLRDVDPFAVTGLRQRQRLRKVDARSRALYSDAFGDCRRIAKEEAHRVGKAAADLMVKALRSEIP